MQGYAQTHSARGPNRSRSVNITTASTQSAKKLQAGLVGSYSIRHHGMVDPDRPWTTSTKGDPDGSSVDGDQSDDHVIRQLQWNVGNRTPNQARRDTAPPAVLAQLGMTASLVSPTLSPRQEPPSPALSYNSTSSSVAPLPSSGRRLSVPSLKRRPSLTGTTSIATTNVTTSSSGTDAPTNMNTSSTGRRGSRAIPLPSSEDNYLGDQPSDSELAAAERLGVLSAPLARMTVQDTFDGSTSTSLFRNPFAAMNTDTQVNNPNILNPTSTTPTPSSSIDMLNHPHLSNLHPSPMSEKDATTSTSSSSSSTSLPSQQSSRRGSLTVPSLSRRSSVSGTSTRRKSIIALEDQLGSSVVAPSTPGDEVTSSMMTTASDSVSTQHSQITGENGDVDITHQHLPLTPPYPSTELRRSSHISQTSQLKHRSHSLPVDDTLGPPTSTAPDSPKGTHRVSIAETPIRRDSLSNIDATTPYTPTSTLQSPLTAISTPPTSTPPSSSDLLVEAVHAAHDALSSSSPKAYSHLTETLIINEHNDQPYDQHHDQHHEDGRGSSDGDDARDDGNETADQFDSTLARSPPSYYMTPQAPSISHSHQSQLSSSLSSSSPPPPPNMVNGQMDTSVGEMNQHDKERDEDDHGSNDEGSHRRDYLVTDGETRQIADDVSNEGMGTPTNEHHREDDRSNNDVGDINTGDILLPTHDQGVEDMVDRKPDNNEGGMMTDEGMRTEGGVDDGDVTDINGEIVVVPPIGIACETIEEEEEEDDNDVDGRASATQSTNLETTQTQIQKNLEIPSTIHPSPLQEVVTTSIAPHVNPSPTSSTSPIPLPSPSSSSSPLSSSSTPSSSSNSILTSSSTPTGIDSLQLHRLPSRRVAILASLPPPTVSTDSSPGSPDTMSPMTITENINRLNNLTKLSKNEMSSDLHNRLQDGNIETEMGPSNEGGREKHDDINDESTAPSSSESTIAPDAPLPIPQSSSYPHPSPSHFSHPTHSEYRESTSFSTNPSHSLSIISHPRSSQAEPRPSHAGTDVEGGYLMAHAAALQADVLLKEFGLEDRSVHLSSLSGTLSDVPSHQSLSIPPDTTVPPQHPPAPQYSSISLPLTKPVDLPRCSIDSHNGLEEEVASLRSYVATLEGKLDIEKRERQRTKEAKVEVERKLDMMSTGFKSTLSSEREERERLEQHVELLKRKLMETQEEYRLKEEEGERKHKNEIDNAWKQRDEIEAELQRARVREADGRTERTRLLDEIETQRREIGRLVGIEKMLKGEVEELVRKVEEKEGHLHFLNEEIKGLRTALQSHVDDPEKVKLEEALKVAIDGKLTALRMKEEAETLAKKSEEARVEAETAREETMEQCRADVSVLAQRLNEQQYEIEVLRKAHREGKHARHVLRDQVATLTEEVRIARADARALQGILNTTLSNRIPIDSTSNTIHLPALTHETRGEVDVDGKVVNNGIMNRTGERDHVLLNGSQEEITAYIDALERQISMLLERERSWETREKQLNDRITEATARADSSDKAVQQAKEAEAIAVGKEKRATLEASLSEAKTVAALVERDRLREELEKACMLLDMEGLENKTTVQKNKGEERKEGGLGRRGKGKDEEEDVSVGEWRLATSWKKSALAAEAAEKAIRLQLASLTERHGHEMTTLQQALVTSQQYASTQSDRVLSLRQTVTSLRAETDQLRQTLKVVLSEQEGSELARLDKGNDVNQRALSEGNQGLNASVPSTSSTTASAQGTATVEISTPSLIPVDISAKELASLKRRVTLLQNAVGERDSALQEWKEHSDALSADLARTHMEKANAIRLLEEMRTVLSTATEAESQARENLKKMITIGVSTSIKINSGNDAAQAEVPQNINHLPTEQSFNKLDITSQLDTLWKAKTLSMPPVLCRALIEASAEVKALLDALDPRSGDSTSEDDTETRTHSINIPRLQAGIAMLSDDMVKRHKRRSISSTDTGGSSSTSSSAVPTTTSASLTKAESESIAACLAADLRSLRQHIRSLGSDVFATQCPIQ